MRKIGFVVVNAVIAALFSVHLAHAESFQVGDHASVQGVVHFEKRYTFVPYGLCDGFRTCPQSKPYWSVVLETESAKFEIDQSFNLGRAEAPESIVIGGSTVLQGSVLRLEGTVEYATSDYYIVGNIQNVRLVMDYVSEASLVSYPNWNCRGNLDRNTEIQVAVWKQLNRYGMRLIGAEESATGYRSHLLAALNDIQAFSVRDNVVYQGRDENSVVQLVIAGAANRPDRDNLLSKLKFSLTQLPSDATKIPAQTQMDVVCNRIR